MSKLKLKDNVYPGKLLVFEGTDGAGKTTLISIVKNLLEKNISKDKILVIKQPTDMSRETKLFQKMMYCKNHDEIDYRAVQLLTMSDRIQHNFEVIKPALKAGKIVICDRYVFTSLANMLARGYNEESWFFDVSKHLLRPNITFLASVLPEIAIKRIKNRPEESERFLDEQLLHNVANEFIKMASIEEFKIIDTSVSSENNIQNLKNLLIKEGILC